MSTRARLRALSARWTDVTAAERANYQLYLADLTEALEVPKPQPAGSGYQFELPIRMVNPDGTTTTRFADLVRDEHFILEAKDAESGRSSDLLLRPARYCQKLWIGMIKRRPSPRGGDPLVRPALHP